MTPLEAIVDLLGASALIGLGCHQLYLKRNVEKLAREKKVTQAGAIRIRKKPMTLIGWALILSGTIFLGLQALKLISN